MISDERLAVIAAHGRESIFPVTPGSCSEMAKELLELRKALSEPAAYEVKGLLCHTLEEAEIYVGEPEPLYRKPE